MGYPGVGAMAKLPSDSMGRHIKQGSLDVRRTRLGGFPPPHEEVLAFAPRNRRGYCGVVIVVVTDDMKIQQRLPT